MRDLAFDEFKRMIEKAVHREVGTYHVNEGMDEKQLMYNYLNVMWPNDKSIAITSDGHDMAFTWKTAEGNEYLECLWVDPEYRHEGRGTALMAELLKRCPSGLSLHVNRDNHGARHLYFKMGLRRYGICRHGTEIFMATGSGLGGKDVWSD